MQVWKDVDGVLSADPRRVDGATPVPFLTFDEATELAYFGAQVLHPHAMRPAMDSDKLAVRRSQPTPLCLLCGPASCWVQARVKPSAMRWVLVE